MARRNQIRQSRCSNSKCLHNESIAVKVLSKPLSNSIALSIAFRDSKGPALWEAHAGPSAPRCPQRGGFAAPFVPHLTNVPAKRCTAGGKGISSQIHRESCYHQSHLGPRVSVFNLPHEPSYCFSNFRDVFRLVEKRIRTGRKCRSLIERGR